ncbi:MAG TPA: amidohydrolase family protein [Acidimicrobiia bacterium]|nr:amidohydrolase family protein [Acidimicrobiia bacterium]
MSLRVVLRSPSGERVVRDVVDGRWAEARGDADTTVGEDLWALPGLVDAHTHLAAAELDYQPGVLDEALERAQAALRAGVTLVLDKGWTDDVTIRLIDQLEEGNRPEIEAAAEIIASVGGYYPGFALEVSEDRFAATVAAQAAAGAGWVKLIGDWPRRGIGPVANFDGAQLRTAVEIAESAGARVAIHTMAREVPSAAVAAGVHSIEHGMFLEESDLDVLGGREGMWVPTVLRCEATLAQLGESSGGGRLFVEGLKRFRSLLPPAIEAGVRVLAGTDLVGSPADVAAEAIRLGDYGLSSRQVVDAVSTTAFVATGRPAVFEVGAPADAVLFAENPIDSLEVLNHPARIIRLGGLR